MLVQNVPVVKYDGIRPLCDVSILNNGVCWEGCLPVCGQVSMKKVEPKKLLLRRGSPVPLCHLSPDYLHLESVLLRNTRGKERSLYLVY